MKILLTVLLALLCGTSVALGQAKPPADDFAKWPVQVKLPPEVLKIWTPNDGKPPKDSGPGPEVVAWVPDNVKKIRGAILIANNTDLVRIGEHTTIRQVATKHELAIVYFAKIDGKLIEWADPPAAAKDGFAAIFDQLSQKTGIAEFKHAPWITLGKSSRGRFAFRPAWAFPDRVIASVAYHGEAPTWPMPEWSKVKDAGSVLHVNVQGLAEWDGTWYRHVRPMLLNYHRHTDWLAHQMVIYGVDHGYYTDYYLYGNHGKPMDKNHKMIRCTDVWDYLALFIDKAVTLRVPKDTYPTDAPTKLLNLKRDDGYLIHPRAPEELLGSKWMALRRADNGDYKAIPWPDETTPVFDTVQGKIDLDKLVVPAANVPADERSNYMWVPDRDIARAWLKLHNLHSLADRVLPPANNEKK